MAWCDFCDCSDCRNGTWPPNVQVKRARTICDRWICDVCRAYHCCPNGRPCEDRNCEHRPKLVGDWQK